MPPGSSSFERAGAPTLRSQASGRRTTRSTYAQLPATSPKKTMESLKSTTTRRKSRQRRTSERPAERIVESEVEEEIEEEVEEEDEERDVTPDQLADRLHIVVGTDYNEGASSSGAPSNSSSSPGVDDERLKRRLSRKTIDLATECYSRSPYRSIAAGHDVDLDKEEPDIPGSSRSATLQDPWHPAYTTGTQELAQPHNLPRLEVYDEDFVLKPKDDYCLPSKPIYCNIQPDYHTDVSLFEKVEPKDPIHYEMTAHDITWIKRLNEQRRLVSRNDYLSQEVFYHIMKSLEIDTFKNIHDHLLDSLHVVYVQEIDEAKKNLQECDVCRVTECDESDEMVFCDMCNTCVHLLCAGMPEAPKCNPWKCKKCEYTNNPAHPCALCPALGGSMTYDPTKTAWAHHVCALFIPEIIFQDEEMRAPITNFDNIAPERKAQLCAICDTRQGACVTCSEQECETTFHVCCALRAGCTIKIQEMPNDMDVLRVTRCQRHSFDTDIRIDEAFRRHKNPWLAKIETYFYVMTNYEKLAESLQIDEIIVSDVYEYWKQKRLRRGGPLIAHLHDHVRNTSTIQRVAEEAARYVDDMQNKAGISIGSMPGSSRPHFFRPAALMVTELRQINLKRADESIRKTIRLTMMIEERETVKKRLHCDVMNQELQAIRKLMATGIPSEEMLDMFKPTKSQMKEAQDGIPDFMKRVNRIKLRPQQDAPVLEMSPLKRKYPAASSLPKTPKPAEKSPLRPRNHNPATPDAGNQRPTSSGTQNHHPRSAQRTTRQSGSKRNL